TVRLTYETLCEPTRHSGRHLRGVNPGLVYARPAVMAIEEEHVLSVRRAAVLAEEQHRFRRPSERTDRAVLRVRPGPAEDARERESRADRVEECDHGSAVRPGDDDHSALRPDVLGRLADDRNDIVGHRVLRDFHTPHATSTAP